MQFYMTGVAFRQDDTHLHASIKKVSLGGRISHLKSTEKDIVTILLDSKLWEQFFFKVRNMYQKFKSCQQSLLIQVERFQLNDFVLFKAPSKTLPTNSDNNLSDIKNDSKGAYSSLLQFLNIRLIYNDNSEFHYNLINFYRK